MSKAELDAVKTVGDLPGISSEDVLIPTDGIRHVDGAKLNRLLRNVNLTGDASGKRCKRSNREAESTDAPERADCLVVSTKAL